MHPATRSLVNLNSLSVNAVANRWVDWECVDDLHQARRAFTNQDFFAYGEGTNLVLVKDIDRLCLHPSCQSLELLSRQDTKVEIAVAAGANWNWLVDYCLTAGWYGLESLAGIPGSCGAAPVQNIGAYGAELSDRCIWVECYDWHTARFSQLTPTECAFSYRDSIFKRQSNLIVVRLGLRLTTSLSEWSEWQKQCLKHTSLDFLPKQQSTTPADFAAAIVATRSAKLPDPVLEPNVGSFFHNPLVDSSDFSELINELSSHSAAWQFSDKQTKLSAAWLIDKCIGKGFNYGKCALAASHALCLVNKNAASGSEILAFADFIKTKVQQQFGVSLVIEPKIVSSC